MKLDHFIMLVVGVALGSALATLTITYTVLNKAPTPLPEARLELSVGGEVKYYKVPSDQVIHVIADGDGNGMSIQLIPDTIPSKSESTPNGQQTNTSVAGNVP